MNEKLVSPLLMAFLVLAMAALACGLITTQATGIVSAQANLEAARAVREQARAMELQSAANLAGQCLAGLVGLAAFMVGALLTLAAMRLKSDAIRRYRKPLTSSGLALPGRRQESLEIRPESRYSLRVASEATIGEKEPEDMIFRGWGW